MYKSISLNGAWEMHYQPEKYKSTEVPPSIHLNKSQYNPSSLSVGTNIIKNAVPGYWEDMIDDFRFAPFFSKLRINPEYGVQSYPIAFDAPDMALPNIMGTFFYYKAFEFTDINNPASIHFEGVQNTAKVWVNNTYIGFHEGYSTPFDIKIPDGVLIKGINEIIISVSNHRLEGYAGEPVSGLTSRAANEYTGGITGNVEIRVYNSPLRDAAVLISEDCSSANVKVDMTRKASFNWYIYDEDEIIISGSDNGDFSFETSGMSFWSPEYPKLYMLKIVCGASSLKLPFGIRRLVPDGVGFKLNNTPYYLRGICEHCYFPETIHPNHDYDYYLGIIKAIKNLGFNFIRFHTYIPEEEYMKAADEAGVLVHVECPNNTSVAEWKEIVKFCRRHTSVVIYCCGNELLIDEPFIEYLNECADEVHKNTDSLFSPLSALRGLEYCWIEPDHEKQVIYEPFKHNPGRFKVLSHFCDMYSSYTNGNHSYESLGCDAKIIDTWSSVYNKPRVSHEICIDGTYSDLSLKDRYKGTRVGNTDMFSSIERHLESKGLLSKAPLYFKNSSEWQRRIRKYCFEQVRASQNIAGYDFLGPIDTHWHTFGYDVGMMNEFCELKPGETRRNVLMYNSPTVILSDIGKKRNYNSGEKFICSILVSHYGKEDITDGKLDAKFICDGIVLERQTSTIKNIENGKVSKIYSFEYTMPNSKTPKELKLYVSLNGKEVFAENEWELYVFPEKECASKNVVICSTTNLSEVISLLKDGKDVFLTQDNPFANMPTSFRISLAGRTSGNLATVINNHPILKDMPNEGFCGWQFAEMMDKGNAVSFEADGIPFSPIIEIVSTHKFAIRQAALFEFKALNGRLIVCSFNFKDTDPASMWLKAQIIEYMNSSEFNPSDSISEQELIRLASANLVKTNGNTNQAFNPNDITAVRKNKTK